MATGRKRKAAPAVTVPSDGWLSVSSAARALGLANATVYAESVKGLLHTQVLGGRVFIHVDSVNAYLARLGREPLSQRPILAAVGM